MCLHIFAFLVPVAVLICILFTSDSNRIMIVNSDTVVKGAKVADDNTVTKDLFGKDDDLTKDLTTKRDV